MRIKGFARWAMFFGLSLFLLGGCGGGGGDGGDPRGQIVSHGEETRFESHEQVGVFLDNIDTSEADPFQPLWDSIKSRFLYPVVMVSMDYVSRNAAGESVTLSGMVAFPWHWDAAKRLPVPILGLQHPTQVERRYSPSRMQILDPELTVPVALAMAATGYIVAVADYEGMGVNYDVHPYCHDSLAFSAVDMIRAARNYLTLHPGDRLAPWDERLFLTGFSEGGYVAMAAAKELQLNHEAEFSVTGVAALDGPYALSGAMRDVMIDATAAFSSPYFLPYVLNGYDAVYGASKPAFDFRRNVRDDVPGHADYPGELLAVMDGSHTGDEITALMREAPGYSGPAGILTAACSTDLLDADSDFCRTLADNDAHAGWAPTMRLKMFHCISDDLVPAGNLDEALAAFQEAGATTVEWEKYPEYIPGLSSIHVGACPVAYMKGYLWLDAIAYPGRK